MNLDMQTKMFDVQKKVVRLIGHLLDEIKALHVKDDQVMDLIRNMSNKLDAVEKGTGEMGGKIKRVYETMRVIGEKRIEDCVYSRGGYCEHITRAIPDPAKVDISTTQKSGRYYPRVRWVDCYFCTKYEVPPSYVEKEKKK